MDAGALTPPLGFTVAAGDEVVYAGLVHVDFFEKRRSFGGPPVGLGILYSFSEDCFVSALRDFKQRQRELEQAHPTPPSDGR